MIQNISINNFGSLINFTNDQNKFACEKTVIHGMNGSGKSQICSVLRQIEKIKKIKILDPVKIKDEEKKILKYIGSRISKESSSSIVDITINNYYISFDSENNVITEYGNIPDIFVFNEDYIKENIGDFLSIQDQEIRIGQKNTQRDSLIRERQEKEKILAEVNDGIDKIIEETRHDLGAYYSKQRRTITTICRENYLYKTNSWNAYPEAKEQLNKLSNPPDAINSHHKYAFPLLSIDFQIKNSVLEILSKVYIEPKLTQEFYRKYLYIKKDFYETGANIYNETKSICPFCLSEKSENDPVLLELINYLFSDYNETLNQIQNIINTFNKKKKEIEQFLSNWNAIIPVINEKLRILSINGELNEIVIKENIFEKYTDLLKEKMENMDKVYEAENIFYSYEFFEKEIKDDYAKQVKMIKLINSEIDKISSLKRNIGNKIIENQMYLLWHKNKLRERHNELIVEINNLNTEIENTSKSAPNNSIPGFFNQITRILGITKYELSPESFLFMKLDADFNINNEGYRISGGERKLIAFSYFLTEVIASAGSYAELSQKTIIIDDPADSSDYEKFYSFITVIENFNNILIKIFDNKEIKFGQMLIFTHNALLFERFSKKLDYYILSLENHKTIISKPKKKISLTTLFV